MKSLIDKIKFKSALKSLKLVASYSYVKLVKSDRKSEMVRPSSNMIKLGELKLNACCSLHEAKFESKHASDHVQI
jgi:hypothetical protein